MRCVEETNHLVRFSILGTFTLPYTSLFHPITAQCLQPACLPASLVNHAVFASDLAKIVAGLYIYAARLQERPETI